MSVVIREMTIEDHPAVVRVWEAADGVGLSDADSREGIAAYLERNAGLSWVATVGGEVIGAVLCGHDGRRGYLHHLAVVAAHRRKGVGRQLVETTLGALKRQGIAKVHLFLFTDNEVGRTFWTALGWSPRETLSLLSKNL